MLGFKNGDLTAWQISGTAMMVTSSTTHPAFADLFHQLFNGYGPVYQYPMYDGEVRGYKWRLATRLDNSFQFLLTKSDEALQRYAADRTKFLSWLAGLVDSDGHIRISNSSGYTRIGLDIGSVNYCLLGSIRKALSIFGYHATGPYRGNSSGFTTPYGITYSRDMWHLYVQRTKEAQLLVMSLPNKHAEKIAQKEMAVSIRLPSKWTDNALKYQKIRETIREKVSNSKNRPR
ncbi:MAG: LAGLIDADG family homing endonuclease [Thaumarchaeota archaeon]|nr:LAGLIDADG family homing endonuclease [Nitrososphaerota archaeon]